MDNSVTMITVFTRAVFLSDNISSILEPSVFRSALVQLPIKMLNIS